MVELSRNGKKFMAMDYEKLLINALNVLSILHVG